MAYQEQIKDIPPEKIACADECGIDTFLYREYGCALRGRQIFGQISGRKYKRCGIVAAKMEDRILAPLQYGGTMDSSLFGLWFTRRLLPSPGNGAVIVISTLIGTGTRRCVTVDMSGDVAEDEGMACGGQMKVLIADVGS